MDVYGEVKLFENSKKKIYIYIYIFFFFFFFFWGGCPVEGGGSGWGGGVQGGCERRSEAFLKSFFFWGGGGSVGLGGGQGGCERRSEAFVKIREKNWVGGGGGGSGASGWGWGVRVDVNGEVKLLWKFKKNNFYFIFFFWGGGVEPGGPIRGWGGGWAGSKVWGRWVIWGYGV